VQLPDGVARIVDERASAISLPALAQAAAELSEAYRGGRAARVTPAERLAAYLVTRMPATYAAAYAVLGEVQRQLAGRPIGSILDLGAGTGAAALAARHWFPEARLSLIEREAALAETARLWLPEAEIVTQDFTRRDPLPPHDLVLAAYALGECQPPASANPMAARIWSAARVALVVIEPGTPRRFASIRKIRADLLAAGAHMLAPCPAETACPMQDPDWCHFAARIERTSLHRKLKGGALGYEDEKYSYIALAREPVELPPARILRHPQHRPGLIAIETCRPEGLRTVRVTKRDRDRFRQARHAKVGQSIF